MDRTIVLFVGGVLILAFVFFALANALLFSNSGVSGVVITPAGNQVQAGSVQVVSLSVRGANYVATPDTVKQNQPVRFVADMQKLPSCSRGLVIPQLNVRKIFSQNDNTVEFTPTQKGPISFSCSMGMYRGTLNVV